MNKPIFFEDLSIGIIVNIKIHRQKNYEKLELVRIVSRYDSLTKDDILKYWGSTHNLLTGNQKNIDPSSYKYQEACKEAIKRVTSASIDRYIFKKTEMLNGESYVVIPVTANSAQNTTITLPELNLFG